jgi:hypothetical protein
MAKINAKTTGGGGIETVGDASGVLELQSDGTTRQYIDANGNVGIGTSSPSEKLQVQGNTILPVSNSYYCFSDNFGVGTPDSSGLQLFSATTSVIRFGKRLSGTFTENMRIDASGNLLVGTTDNNIGGGGAGFKFIASSTIPNVGQVINTAGAYNTYHLYNTNATNNGYRFYVSANGGINNFSGNNVNLSDERTKANIELSGNYLEKICAIPVKLFNYKDELEGEQRTLGVIAQDVEAVAPEFVNNDGWEGTAPEDGLPLKTIYTTDMMFGLMKAIQEQQAIITDLKARIEALENSNGID